MFELQEIDPEVYRQKTRKATYIVMAIFIVIGFFLAYQFEQWFGAYSSNHLVLNFLGAFVGLLITAAIMKAYFVNKPWMAEVVYGWQLKRNLMKITNIMRPLEEAVAQGDETAMKILRFYHLGIIQMYRLDDNHHGLIDIMPEKEAFESKLVEKGIDLNQTVFDPIGVDRFKAQL